MAHQNKNPGNQHYLEMDEELSKNLCFDRVCMKDGNPFIPSKTVVSFLERNENKSKEEIMHEYNKLEKLPKNKEINIVRIGRIEILHNLLENTYPVIVTINDENEKCEVQCQEDVRTWKDYNEVINNILMKQMKTGKKVLPKKIYVDEHFRYIEELKKL